MSRPRPARSRTRKTSFQPCLASLQAGLFQDTVQRAGWDVAPFFPARWYDDGARLGRVHVHHMAAAGPVVPPTVRLKDSKQLAVFHGGNNTPLPRCSHACDAILIRTLTPAPPGPAGTRA